MTIEAIEAIWTRLRLGVMDVRKQAGARDILRWRESQHYEFRIVLYILCISVGIMIRTCIMDAIWIERKREAGYVSNHDTNTVLFASFCFRYLQCCELGGFGEFPIPAENSSQYTV